ncbi:type 11 methyltransferase [Mucor ambiguus]|uniref:Type 11 methyltransferase n=1 Tax=Mucor ambiguus TaxID=91626 RepID=A0A0C9MFV8_9FUNG|nr:type 11 methyltransferase [Mucor ambiguus]
MLGTATKSSQQQNQAQKKKKQQHHQGDKLSSSSSPTWLLNWFSQLTKPSLKSSSSSSNSSVSTAPSVVLPWKNSHKSLPSSSVVITDPINVPTIKYTPSSENVNRPEKQPSTQPPQQSQQLDQHRPSITISLTPSVVSSERRNSQQTISSSLTTSDDQYSTTAASYYQRRDSSERSILSELWSKARRRHPHYPRFHWPHRHAQSLGSSPQQQPPYMRVQPPTADDSITAAQAQAAAAATSCPSSYRHQHYFPRHFKRHSISSLMTSADNTPSGSRPNSVVLSQPTSPNFAALLVKRQNEDDDVDNYWLSDDNSCSCQVSKKERWIIKHELIKLAVDGLFSIPEMVTLSSSIEKHVLQIGCGDAAWSIDVAIQYPKWIVVGLDDGDGGGGMSGLSFKRSIPRNFKFIRRNSILQGLKNLPDGTFDFIAFRLLLLGYTFEQYQALITECLRVCKPGGYIEVMEMDMRIYHQRVLSISITQLLNNEVISAIEFQSLDPRLARRLQDLVVDEEEKTHIEVKYISLPLGVWGGRLGVMFRDDIHALIESYQSEIADASQKLARSETELEYKMELMDHELDSNRAFMNLHLMVIQKAML